MVAMVVTAQDGARRALVWASLHTLDSTGEKNNFEVFRSAVSRYAKSQGEFESFKTMEDLFTGFSHHCWQCLLRLLIMGDPQLICYAMPRYTDALDSYSATTWLCTEYHRITGKRPAVRSWRIAKQEVIG